MRSLVHQASINRPQATLAAFKSRPGSPKSLWNTAIPAGATYGGTACFPSIAASTSGMVGYSQGEVSMSPPFYIATASDPVVSVLYGGDVWSWINTQLGSTGHKALHTGNTSPDETTMRGLSSTSFPSGTGRYVYSSTNKSTWVIPSTVKVDPSALSSVSVHCPSGATPCMDSDGAMSIMQPDGRILDMYEVVILADGTIICENCNLIDSSGLIDGNAGGCTASMIPFFAGLIRQADLTAGAINHALAGVFPPAQLSSASGAVVLPALAYDRSTTYSGTFSMGQRFALPTSFNAETYSYSSTNGILIGRALKAYGIIPVDTGGGGIVIRAEGAISNAEFNEDTFNGPYNLLGDVQNLLRNVQTVTF